MFFHHKKHRMKLALWLSGLAFFAVASAYSLVKIDAALNQSSARLFGIGNERVEIHLASPIASSPSPVKKVEEDKKISVSATIQNSKNKTNEVSETDQAKWQNAEDTLKSYFSEINAGNYSKAIAVRNSKFLVGSAESYVSQLKNSKENDVSGDVSISQVERIESESKEDAKVFRFQKSCTWSFDQKVHNEIKKAVLELHEGEWKIDYFELERKF